MGYQLQFNGIQVRGSQLPTTMAETIQVKTKKIRKLLWRKKEKTKRPAARLDLVENQMRDPLLGAFAFGNINNKTWYRSNPEESEKILTEMIDAVNKGEYSISKAISIAESRLNEITK